MSRFDLKGSLFYEPRQIAAMFGKPLPWVYRAASGFLKPAARKFNSRALLFLRSEVDRIIREGPDAGTSLQHCNSNAIVPECTQRREWRWRHRKLMTDG